MRTLVEGTDHGRGPQWVKLSDDDARRAHDMNCSGATFEELRRHFRVRTAGSTWDIAWNALGLPNWRHQR
jgi:hypothetical protein